MSFGLGNQGFRLLVHVHVVEHPVQLISPNDQDIIYLKVALSSLTPDETDGTGFLIEVDETSAFIAAKQQLVKCTVLFAQSALHAMAIALSAKPYCICQTQHACPKTISQHHMHLQINVA